MKIDLDQLERCARLVGTDAEDPMDDGPAIAICDPAVTLALIARIRTLDEALNDALAHVIPGDERDRLVRVLAELDWKPVT